jgi:hypothetical protein
LPPNYWAGKVNPAQDDVCRLNHGVPNIGERPMSTQNSHDEFILGVYRSQLEDCGRWYPELAKEFTRDFQRLSSAIDSHGVRFTLDVMPLFRKHFDKCLAGERLTPSGLCHFGVDQKGGNIPRLFRGLVLRVFDRSGLLKCQPDFTAVQLLRQLLGVVRKLELAANVKDSGNAVLDFYQVDREVRLGDLPWEDSEAFAVEVATNDASFTGCLHSGTLHGTHPRKDETTPSSRPLSGLLSDVQRVADIIASDLGPFDPYDWKLRHGPGAVADRKYGVSKYSFSNWSDRLESVFPYADFALANYSCVDLESIEEPGYKDFVKEPSAKLCTVPKTIKTPRLIATEPLSHQWCQQAVLDFFYSRVKKTVYGRFIDFHDQTKNGSLALEASHTRSHATIDLSSASDRISCWHVERLFRRSPSLLLALQSTRTRVIEQSICRYSPKVYHLRKYSTMGNATTFPVQSLFFLALAIACVLNTRGLRVSKRAIASLKESEVRVFGDDIIVPDDCSKVLVGLLSTLEMRVNEAKTFLDGNFRESCGVDAFDGHDVTTVNVTQIPSSTNPSSIVASVDAHNNLLRAGFVATSAFLRKAASFLGYTKVREVKLGDGAFGWQVFGVPSLAGFRTRVSKSLQRLEILCLQPLPAVKRGLASGNSALLQFFTEAAKKVTSAKSTLGYLVQRPKTRLGLRWVPA